jgi:hypothetical protein
MNIDKVDPKNREGLKVDKKGNVLCPLCNNELAWVCWGVAEPCAKCEKIDLIKGETMH